MTVEAADRSEPAGAARHEPDGPHRPAPLVRVASLPPAALAGLRCARTAAETTRLLDLDARLTAGSTALAADLHGAIGALDDPVLRPRLVGLRRAVHRRALPDRAEWSPAVQAALPRELAERVTAWAAGVQEHRHGVAALDGLLAAEAAAASEAVRSAAADPAFRRALIRSSPTLDTALERWLAGGAVRPQVVLRLARYLARAVAKTSPYGTFTLVGAGRWVDGDALAAAVAPVVPVPVAEVDALLTESLRRVLLTRPETAAVTPLRVTPGLVRTADGLSFLGPGPAEPVVTLGDTPAVRAVLRAVGAGGSTRAELAAELAAAGADPAGTGPFLDRLVGLGLLEPCPPGSDPAALASWARSAGDPLGLSAPLLALDEAVRRPVPVPDLAGHRERQRAVGERAAAVATAAGLTTAAQVARDHPGAVAHEHALAAGPVAECGRAAWAPVLADLAVLRRWLAVHDPALPLRLVLGDWVAARLGPGAALPFVLLHRAVRQEVAGPPPDALGAELGRRLDAAGAVPAAKPTGPVQRLRTLGELRLAAAAPLAADPDPDGVVRVDPAALAAVTGTRPPWVGDPGSVACFVQIRPGPAAGVVLNGVTVGHGRGWSRWQHLARAAGQPPPVGAGTRADRDRSAAGHRCGPEPVELGGTFGTALNRRLPATRLEIDYPGTVSGRPAAERIPLGALVAVHDRSTGLIGLVDGRSGRPVRPVHLGLVVEALLPAAARLLVRLGGLTVLPPGWSDPAPARPGPEPAAVAATPRVEVGRVTLRRARWVVRAAALTRRAGERDAAYLLRLAAWRRRYGVPARAFLHTGGGGAATGGSFDKRRKPLYVDWDCWPLAADAERYLRGGAELAVLEEALPDPGADGAGRATELLVDVPGCGCGH